jgi:GTPase SAR1 family protein
LVANKKDKVSDREVTREKGENFSIENKLAGFFETSAKTGDNVEATFATAARMLFQ